MIGKRYEAEKKIWGGDRGNQYTNEASSQVGNLAKRPKTGELIADEYGIGKTTVYRNADFAKVVDTLPEEVKQDVLSGKEKIRHEDVSSIIEMEAPIKKQFLKEVEKGTPIKEAVKKVDPELKRKERDDFVRALRIMLSGTPEDMQRIEATGKLDKWCEDKLDWLHKTYGADNVVSAVLHMDEKTPHIHATVVPIVTGERRKTKEKQKREDKPEQNAPGKKKYRKKNANAPRLCADDVMTRENLKLFQDTYAEAMAKYGLKRGIDGSEAKHTTNQEYYRELFVQKDELQEYVKVLQEEKAEINEKIRDLYDRKDEAREKFLNMHEYNKQKETEISETESRLEQLKKDYKPYKAQEDMDLFFGVFPKLNEHLRTVQLCKVIGLTVETIKKLFNGEIVPVTGKLHSPEHDQDFNVQDVKLQLFKEQDNPNKFRLSLNGQNILDWFRQKYQEIKQTIRPHIKPPAKPEVGKNKGIKR